MLRFSEGWDHSSSSGVEFTSKWTGMVNSTFSISSTAGRFGNGIDLSFQTAPYKTLDAQPTWIVGTAVKILAFGAGFNLIRVTDGGTAQDELKITSAGLVQILRNGTQLDIGTVPLALGIWYYIEFKVTIHNSTGEAEARVNGVTHASVSGADTQNTANATADRIYVGIDINTTVYLDDIYMCDGVDSGVSGAPNDDFLDDVRVEACFPNGNGNSSQLVGQDANSTDNYLNVDETDPDDDTTYNESGTVGQKDTYTYTNLTPTTGTVYGVQILPYARKTDAGSRSIVTVARLSTTEEDGPVQALSTSYQYLEDIREGDPNGDQWTISNINSAEFGVKINA